MSNIANWLGFGIFMIAAIIHGSLSKQANDTRLIYEAKMEELLGLNGVTTLSVSIPKANEERLINGIRGLEKDLNAKNSD